MENCEIAYETTPGNKRINSLDYDFVPYYGEVTTECAKCHKFYCYNASSKTCELNEFFECEYCIITAIKY